jgi:hypothetical protein
MAQTYAWVVEQEGLKLQRTNRKTEHWVLEQQIFFAQPPLPLRPDGLKAEGVTAQQRVWEELMCGYEVDATRWMRHEEEARSAALARERQKKQQQWVVDDELRRIEARIRHRKTDEKQRLVEERQRAHTEAREREQRERLRAERAATEAWQAYEDRWAALNASCGLLRFGDIPWPVGRTPAGPGGITPAGIVLFLFSALEGQSRKERIRGAQLRWHPDRFRRVMGRVVEEERERVEEGVGIVARCLNDLMRRENSVGA